MDHLHAAFGVGGMGTERAQGSEGNRGGETKRRMHGNTFLVVMRGKTVACIALEFKYAAQPAR
jgi:hypothetical protein